MTRFATVKRATARALANPRTGRLVARVLRDRIPSRGIVINTNSPVIRDEIKAFLALGIYESSERRLVTRFLRRDLPIVELGASIGFITGQIARLRPPRQIAVEADPRLVPMIADLLEANALPPVELVHGAIDYSGRATACFWAGDSNITGGVAGDRSATSNPTEFMVPAFTLRELVRQAALERFALVCDIEGAERGMILREEPSAAHTCEQMFIELHAGEYDGRHWSTDALAGAIEAQWEMRAVRRDGNNWMFERRRHGAGPKS